MKLGGGVGQCGGPNKLWSMLGGVAGHLRLVGEEDNGMDQMPPLPPEYARRDLRSSEAGRGVGQWDGPNDPPSM